MNTAIDFGLFNLLFTVSATVEPSVLVLFNLISASLATVASYHLNKHWTFRMPESHSGHYITRFVAATAIGIIINSVVASSVSFALAAFPVPSLLAVNIGKVIGALTSSAWRFISYRGWVFRADKMEQPVIPSVFTSGLISLIIPAYNEMHRLPGRLQRLVSELDGRLSWEIIVVDDGSTDDTPGAVMAMASRYPLIRLLSVRHQGKGAAVRAGMRAAQGEYLLYTDADDTFTAEHIGMVVERLLTGTQVVMGCRYHDRESSFSGQSLGRSIMGRVFNLMVRLLVLPGMKDTQCGLKGFQRPAAEQLVKRLRVNGFAFDVELLCLARELGMEIVNIPVQIEESEGSRVRWWLSPLQMFRDLLLVKCRMITDGYDLPGRGQWASQAALGFSLVLLALVIRIPWLWDVPRYIDELREVNLAYLIYLGRVFPLHNVAHDIGPLHNYIIAGIFRLLGPSIYWPRLYVALTSAITVLLVYRLGSRFFNNWTGLIAAGLVLTNGMNILVTHMAWANSTTPFFFMLALIATMKAEREASGPSLVGAALLWAAALQTHSSVVIYFLVALIYVTAPGFRKRVAIRSQYYTTAALVFLAGYSNMICYNLVSGGGSIAWLSHKGYTMESHPGLRSFARNLEQMAIELIRAASSTYADHNSFWQYLLHPWFALALLFLLAGSYFALRNKISLPFWMMSAPFAVMPWINQRYTFFLATRYIMPVVILASILIAYGLVQTISRFSVKINLERPLPASVWTCLLLAAGMQLFAFYSYCRQIEDTSSSNRLPLNIINQVNNLAHGRDTIVIIDRKLAIENNPLPSLLTLTSPRYKYVAWDPAESRTPWAAYHRLYPGYALVTIMTEATYRQSLAQRPDSSVSHLTCRVLSATGRTGLRSVYLQGVPGDSKTSTPAASKLDLNISDWFHR
jgi:putative flippase GtrA